MSDVLPPADDRSPHGDALVPPRTEITDWMETPPVVAGRLPLSLLTNLRALSEDLTPKRLRSVLAELSDRVERGEPMTVAFSAVRDRLPTGLAALFDVGLARGRVDLLLGSYLDHARRLSDLRRSIWMSLSYPVVLGLLVASVGLLLPLFIVPVFKSIFEDFGTELPWLTQVIVQLSDFLRSRGVWVLLGLGVFITVWWVTLRALGGEALPQRAFRSIPCIGRVFRWASLAGFTETLAILVDMQAPLPVALRMAGQTTDDLTLADRATRLADELDQGRPLEDLSDRFGLLGRELGGVMRWAGKPQLFVDALRSSGEIFAARSRVELHLAAWMFEPFALFFVAVSAGVILLSMFLPLIKLLNDLS